MNCPHCSSDQTQRLSAIFEAGTSVVESKLSGGGVALTGDGLAPVIGSGSSKGIQQTALAAKASPPEKQPVGQFLLLVLLGSPFLAFALCFCTDLVLDLFGASPTGLADNLPEIVAVGTWVLLSALGVAIVVLAHRFNRDEWPSLYAAWQARWLCHRCGELFDGAQERQGSSARQGSGAVSQTRTQSPRKPQDELHGQGRSGPAHVSPVVSLIAVAVVTICSVVGVALVFPPDGDPEPVVVNRAPARSPERPARQAPSSERRAPNIVGTTLVEPWKFLGPVTIEKAADVLASAAIDFVAKSKPSELTAWKAEILVLDRDIREHRVGELNFDFQWIRRHLTNTGGVSAQMESAARSELTSSIRRKLSRFKDIGLLTSGWSSAEASASTASPLPQAHEPRYEWLTASILVADFQVGDGESAKDAAPRLVELGKDLCLIPGAELAKLRVLDAGGRLVGTLDLPLTSFLDFHSSDATDRMMATRMWDQNAVLFLRNAGLR